MVRLLLEFDKQKKYHNISSKNFYFKTYLFDLGNSTYNEMELDFMDNVKNGFWMAKDPKGSLGKGI